MTFLPYPSFEASAMVLDRSRLGKQRVEGLQILYALTGRSGAHRNHPATRMWLGYEACLANYVLAMCAEWSKRGYRDTVAVAVVSVVKQDQLDLAGAERPPWLDDGRLHSSHRSNLLRKLPSFYGLVGWTESPDQRYFWPKQALRSLPVTRPGRDTKKMDSETQAPSAPAAEAPAAPSARQSQLDSIKAICAEVKASANPAIGEKNAARLGQRLAIIERVATSAISRLEKQEKYATRPRRAKKAAEPAAAPQA